MSSIKSFNKRTADLYILKTNINLEFLTKKKIVINDISLSTKYLYFNEIKPLFKKVNINNQNLKLVKNCKFKIKNFKLNLD